MDSLILASSNLLLSFLKIMFSEFNFAFMPLKMSKGCCEILRNLFGNIIKVSDFWLDLVITIFIPVLFEIAPTSYLWVFYTGFFNKDTKWEICLAIKWFHQCAVYTHLDGIQEEWKAWEKGPGLPFNTWAIHWDLVISVYGISSGHMSASEMYVYQVESGSLFSLYNQRCRCYWDCHIYLTGLF